MRTKALFPTGNVAVNLLSGGIKCQFILYGCLIPSKKKHPEIYASIANTVDIFLNVEKSINRGLIHKPSQLYTGVLNWELPKLRDELIGDGMNPFSPLICCAPAPNPLPLSTLASWK